MSDINNPLVDIEQEYKFAMAIDRFVVKGLRDVREDTPPLGSSFLDLWDRALPYIHADNPVLPEYKLDYSWRKYRN